MLNGCNILVTGGTGSFGNRFIATLIEHHKPNKIVVYSRDELKQFEMSNRVPFAGRGDIMRYFLGDVRDLQRLERAMEGIDIVVHAAALKQVPAAEYNPFEAVKTNIIGGQNVIDACLAANVKSVIALSTDKAAAPINLYGATKLCSDKLFVAANNYRGARGIRFSVVRYGNVLGSRGSVVPFFQQRRPSGILPVTDERMTRFSITLQQGVDFVLDCLKRMWGGELFVPKIPSYRILDVAKAIAPECRIEVVGIRPGEKLHEEMITDTDSLNTLEFDGYYVILPSNSGDNPNFLSAEKLRDLAATELHV
ncbi:MAG: UDP-N-acetylglucosamine 4,6-dehydratase (inverting) [Betaproteobacteria bacterium]|nr:UDP-N-acetylglucosamine 4,6-dehydratase (inverting) [Betaproteobacteria bacterium]